MSRRKPHSNSEQEYTLEEECGKIRELYFTAKGEGRETVEIPTRLAGFISMWLIQHYNLKGELAACREDEQELTNLLRTAQAIYNGEGRPDAKDKEIRRLLGIYKQRSLDSKELAFDDVQLFKEYARIALAWMGKDIDGEEIDTNLKGKDLTAKKWQIIEVLRVKYDIASKEAVVTRLKKGKSLLEGDTSEYEGVLPSN